MEKEISDGYVELRRTCRDFMATRGVLNNPGFTDDNILVSLHELLLGSIALPVGLGPECAHEALFDAYARFRHGVESVLLMAGVQLPFSVTNESIAQALTQKS